jgi:hypothetical protein
MPARGGARAHENTPEERAMPARGGARAHENTP